MNVLIVDDEPLARERLTQMLGEIPGARVVGSAANGRTAIDEIRACGAMVRSNDEWLETEHGQVLAGKPIVECLGYQKIVVPVAADTQKREQVAAIGSKCRWGLNP